MRFLILLALLSFGVRFVAVVAMRDIHQPPNRQQVGADGVEYNALAKHVAKGKGYVWESGQPTSFRAPGFPLFLSVIHWLTGSSYPTMHVVFCLLGAASCLLTYLLARELLPRATARVAGLLAAVYLPHVYFATRFDSENLFVPCLGLGMWMFVLHLKRGSVSWLLLSGLAFGAGALTRPFVLLLVPLLGLLLLFRSGTGFRRRLWVAASFTISFLVPVLPWTARNWMVHGKPVLIATNGGSTFYGSNNTIVATDWQLLGAWVSTTKLPGRDAIDATPNEIAHDALEWRLGIEWVRDHPSLMPQLVAAKFVRLWLPDVESANRKYVLLQLLTYTPFLLLILAGLWGIWRSSAYYNSPWLAIHLTILATVVTGLLFWGSPRFRDANTPLLMMYAAVGAQAFVLARRRTALANPAEVHAGVN